MSAVSKEQVLEFFEKMTLLEAKGFIKEFEERFGVSAAAPMAFAAPAGGGGGGGAAAAEEKTEFTIVLSNSGDKKINVIKVIREITGLGLKEAKDLVEGAPKTVKEGVSKDEAAKIKKSLEDQGAKVDLK